MPIAYSRLTAKSQTTVPIAVRKALSLQPGDSLVYEAHGDTVTLRKVAGSDIAYLRAVQATLSEWNTPEDAAAYDDL